MDPLTIATSCLTLAGTVAKVSQIVRDFMRTAHYARKDLDSISRELHSLQTTLELLAEDTKETSKTIPLAKQISGIVDNCNSIVQEIEKVLQKHGKGKLVGTKWAWSGKDDVTRLQSILKAHESALELVLEVMNLYALFEVQLNDAKLTEMLLVR